MKKRLLDLTCITLGSVLVSNVDISSSSLTCLATNSSETIEWELLVEVYPLVPGFPVHLLRKATTNTLKHPS